MAWEVQHMHLWKTNVAPTILQNLQKEAPINQMFLTKEMLYGLPAVFPPKYLGPTYLILQWNITILTKSTIFIRNRKRNSIFFPKSYRLAMWESNPITNCDQISKKKKKILKYDKYYNLKKITILPSIWEYCIVSSAILYMLKQKSFTSGVLSPEDRYL